LIGAHRQAEENDLVPADCQADTDQEETPNFYGHIFYRDQ